MDQENAADVGGQAYWSFGGLFLAYNFEQRRLGARDRFDLAWFGLARPLCRLWRRQLVGARPSLGAAQQRRNTAAHRQPIAPDQRQGSARGALAAVGIV